MMDYFDHDEKEQKRMRNSSGLVRLYNSTDSGDDTDAEKVAASPPPPPPKSWKKTKTKFSVA